MPKVLFPFLVDCCALDWYSAWPSAALQSVAEKLLKDEPHFPEPTGKINQNQMIINLASISKEVHLNSRDYSIIFESALKRKVYYTPKSYLDLIKLYIKGLKKYRNAM